MNSYTENTALYDYYDYNQTLDDENDSLSVGCPGSHLLSTDIFLPVVYYLIFFTGVFGNIFVIVVVGSKNRRSGRLVDTFVINLALADLIFVFTLPLWAISASQNDHWGFGAAGNLLCKLSSYIIAVNRVSNISFLTCMSVDRYLAVVKLMDSRYLRTSGCIRITCAAVWVSSLVFGIPSWVYRDVIPVGGRLSCLEDNSSSFFLALSLTMTLVTFVLPVLIIVICYGTIVLHLNKHCVTAVNPRADARRRHSLKMVLSIIVAFVASWLPFNIFKTIILSSRLAAAQPSCGVPPWQSDGLVISCCLAFLNSCVNPAIYFFLDHHFRRQAQLLYKTCSTTKTKVPPSHNSTASFTNTGNSESFGTTGGGKMFHVSD